MKRSDLNYALTLCRKEGWEVTKKENPARGEEPYSVLAYGQIFPAAHPYQIHLTLYRKSSNPDQKYLHMKAAHDYLWPEFGYSWNHWDERRFRAHCEGYKYIVMAGGAGVAKSHAAARIACLFWLSDPKNNACIIASTTLEALESRIWGYAAKFMDEAALPLPIKILQGKPPKIMRKSAKEKIHGMFAVAVRQGDSDAVTSSLIGRHPNKGLMIVLDEATDMNARVVEALPNLEKGISFFQCWAIGNSSSHSDLHGALATPKNGWDSVDPDKDFIWETTYDKGVCLYFNPYDSPAIKEKDPVRKAVLSTFLPTLASLEKDKEVRGETSEAFWRFVMGFWKSRDLETTIASKAFVTEHQVNKGAEWTGFFPLDIVAGLDPAFQVGGTGCVLRLAILGHTSDRGKICIDYREEELLFRIQINTTNVKSGELQLAEEVVRILKEHNCPIRNLTIDATGAGRALGEVVRFVNGGGDQPIRIVSNALINGARVKDNDPSIIVSSPYDMWFKFREFIQNSQVRGLDRKTIAQFTNRQVIRRGNKMVLESKIDYRIRMTAINPTLAHSPDEADAAILACQSAIYKFGFHAGQSRGVPATDDRDFFYKKMHAFERAKLGDRTVTEERAKTRPQLIPNFSGSMEDIPKG